LFGISNVAMEMRDALNSKKCGKLGNTIMYKYNKSGCSCLETRIGRTTHEIMIHGNVKLLINITIFIHIRQENKTMFTYITMFTKPKDT
jgi:hypothetical protein